MIKSIIQQALYQGLQPLGLDSALDDPSAIQVEYTRHPQYGDFSSNIALNLTKAAQLAPRVIAEKIKAALFEDSTRCFSKYFSKIEIAGPGFINFFLLASAWTPVLTEILNQKIQYGEAQIGKGSRVLVEFVSSNPTGPLHVGHGRQAVLGDVVARLLKTIGYQVHAEYYVNDAGRQMDIVTCSVWLRYLEQGGAVFNFPENGYQGDYVSTIAQNLRIEYGAQFYPIKGEKIDQIIARQEIQHPENPDQHIDALIEQAKLCLGKAHYSLVNKFSLHAILEDMQADLSEFNVLFDEWFSERSLFTTGAVEEVIESLTRRGHTYLSEDNVLWFRSTHFGDDKDRVLVRANGQATYFAADAAYRLNILKQRKFDQIINILGADHHGYVPRIQAVIQALGYESEQVLKVSFVQFVALYRGQEKLSMSTRKGSFITLRALRGEVGHDAARLFYIMRKSEQHLNFDLALVKSQSQENPVYYLQYAYARICSLMRQLEAKGYTWEIQTGLAALDNLQRVEEVDLIKQMARYPETIVQAGTQCEPYLLMHYLHELAQSFHSYYNQVPLLTPEVSMRNARITLIQAVKQVFENGFHLLGVNSPTMM